MAVTPATNPFTVSKIHPQLVAKGKLSTSLARGAMLGVGVQVVSPDGGETNLHSHPGVDSAWIVLDGSAAFYTTGDELVADIGKYEMVFIPQGVPYWFKASSETPVVILHLTARAPGLKGPSRMDYAPPIEKARDVIPGAFFEA
jgi:mannose-6-phosphate isomerase-like protein (cupin superfamily)